MVFQFSSGGKGVLRLFKSDHRIMYGRTEERKIYKNKKERNSGVRKENEKNKIGNSIVLCNRRLDSSRG